jgi:hypothetical protein
MDQSCFLSSQSNRYLHHRTPRSASPDSRDPKRQLFRPSFIPTIQAAPLDGNRVWSPYHFSILPLKVSLTPYRPRYSATRFSQKKTSLGAWIRSPFWNPVMKYKYVGNSRIFMFAAHRSYISWHYGNSFQKWAFLRALSLK